MSVRRTIPAGVLDSGLASLATFVVGVQAVRVLDPTSLGAYGLMFAGFTLLAEFSTRLIFLPAEIEAARWERPERLGLLPSSLRAGAGPVVFAGLVLMAVSLLMPGEVDAAVVAALLITAVPCTMISPVQDHVRKVLHIGDRSYAAAFVSGVHLLTTIVSLVVFGLTDVAPSWQPFGALLLANIVSAAVAVALWWRARTAVRVIAQGFRTLVRAGGWHLLAGASPKAAALAAASVVAHIAGAPALGYAEGARILARPVAVLSQGIIATIGPPLMRAAAARDADESRRLSRLYAALVGAAGTAYFIAAGFPWPFNPLPSLLPAAFVVPGLTAAMIAVFTIDRIAGAGAWMQLFGVGRQRAYAVVETVSSVGQSAAAFAAVFIGPFAIPLGYGVASLIRRPWMAVLVRQIYAEDAAVSPSEPAGI